VFSPDGRTLATASREPLVKLWDTSDWSERGRIKHPSGEVILFQFTGDGRRAMTGGRDRTVRDWDTRSLAEGRPVGGDLPSAGVARAVISPDGATVAAAGPDGQVVFWDVAGRSRLRTLEPPAGTSTTPPILQSLTLSPDGGRLAGVYLSQGSQS